MIYELKEMGCKAILLRSAGFNHADIRVAAECGIPVLRVPSYSPEAVAEFAMALLLTVNRHTHRAYTRTKDFNMNINGFMGIDLHGKTAGVVGTGTGDCRGYPEKCGCCEKGIAFRKYRTSTGVMT